MRGGITQRRRHKTCELNRSIATASDRISGHAGDGSGTGRWHRPGRYIFLSRKGCFRSHSLFLLAQPVALLLGALCFVSCRIAAPFVLLPLLGRLATPAARAECRNLTLVWFAFGGGRGPPGLLADPTCSPLPPGSGTVVCFRAIHLTIFWGTGRGHVGQRTDARTGHRRCSPVREQQR